MRGFASLAFALPAKLPQGAVWGCRPSSIRGGLWVGVAREMMANRVLSVRNFGLMKIVVEKQGLISWGSGIAKLCDLPQRKTAQGGGSVDPRSVPGHPPSVHLTEV